MISLKTVMAAINKSLSDNLELKINDNDFIEGFKRPSLYVKFEDISRVEELYSFERSFMVRIHYFPTDRHKYQFEIMEKQEMIEELFKKGITVEERFIKVDGEVNSEIYDGVLQVSFRLSYLDDDVKEGQTPEYIMENLYVGD